MKISEQKQWRRQRLAALIKEFGARWLADQTNISEAYLFQMSSAVGKQSRPVNDNVATKIEEVVRRPGWFAIAMSPEQNIGSRKRASSLSPEAIALIQKIEKADSTRSVSSDSWKNIGSLVDQLSASSSPPKPTPKGIVRS